MFHSETAVNKISKKPQHINEFENIFKAATCFSKLVVLLQAWIYASQYGLTVVFKFQATAVTKKPGSESIWELEFWGWLGFSFGKPL